MKFPELTNPARYTGLYVLELNGQTAVGYTAEEVELLLESEAHRAAKIFRIHRAMPNGELELVGVHPDRFQLESGMFFYRPSEAEARQDFAQLKSLAADRPGPCRATIHLAQTKDTESGAYCVILLYPAEYDADVSAWLLEGEYEGGTVADGGISAVTNYRQAGWNVIERHPILPQTKSGELAPRNRAELVASLGRTMQRKLA